MEEAGWAVFPPFPTSFDTSGKLFFFQWEIFQPKFFECSQILSGVHFVCFHGADMSGAKMIWGTRIY